MLQHSLPFIVAFYGLVIIGNTILGIFVWRKDKNSATNRLFWFLSLTTSFWLFSVLLERVGGLIGWYTIWLPRLNLFLATPQILFIFLLAHTLPSPRLYFSKVKVRLLCALFLVISILNLTPFVFSKLDSGAPDPYISTVHGALFIVFAFFAFSFSAFSIYFLIKNFRQAVQPERQQIKFVLIGLALMVILLSSTVVLMVLLFGNGGLLYYSPLFVLIFLIFTAIAILKYKLFNLKLLVTESLVFILGALFILQFFIFNFTAATFSRLTALPGFHSFEIFFNTLVFLLAIYLGLIVLVKDWRSATARVFFSLCLAIAANSAVNYLSLHPPGGAGESQLFWIRIVMFVAAFFGPLFLTLAVIYPGKIFNFPKKYFIPLIIFTLITAALCLLPFVFTGIAYPNGQPLPIPGLGMPFFILSMVGLPIVAIAVLIYRYRRADEAVRKQLWYLMVGAGFTFVLTPVVSVIAVVFFKTSATVFMGPIFALIFIGFVAFGLVRRGIVNIKILATELIVGFIAILISVEGVVSGIGAESVFKMVFAVLVIILGLLLVKSVKREIEQEKKLAMAGALEESNRQLRDLDRQKTEFLNIAAHQLRTPASVINNYVAMLKDGDYGVVPGQISEVLSHIDQSNQWMVRLADEFLNIAHIESGQTKFHMSGGDLSRVIREVVVELVPKAKQKELLLEIKEMPDSLPAHFDEEKMKHVILNFVDNAIKYTPSGSVSVFARVSNGSGVGAEYIQPSYNAKISGIEVVVRDTGIGFSDIDKERFFRKFQRGENAKQYEVNSSTGLGLYIARKFVEGHGGTVWAKSEGENRGSEFGFWLPVK